VTGPLDLLRDRAGAAALAAAEELIGTGGGDPLGAATALRSRGYGAELASAALTQATLRRRAVAKFGPDAARMFFTAAGLEQATRGVVADRRAQRLAVHGAGRVADLGCGIGADTVALARAGLRVLAVEADPTTAAVAAANVDALGLSDRVDVQWADATTTDLSDVDVVFCDPARRQRGNGKRIFDPSAYSPPWSFVEALPRRVPATVVKVAPGLDHALIPAGAEAAWVSVDGDVVEATLWCGPLAAVPRRATLLRGSTSDELMGTGLAEAPVGPPGRFLYDLDGAVVRAHLVAEFAATVDGRLADPRIAYVFADQLTVSPYARCFEVLETLPFARKRLRAALRTLDIGRLEILKRGLAIDPDQLRRELYLDGSRGATLVLARFGDTPTALLCSPYMPDR
jgi:SAM-dependent methyltransferase